jgi:tellurite resistance protein
MSEREVSMHHFKNLIAVSMVDGVLDDDEREFLEERADELGLPSDEVSEAIANADKLKFVVPEDAEDKEEQLADIVFMSMADGTIEDKEYQLCLNIAERLELKKEDLDEVIALTKRLWNRS